MKKLLMLGMILWSLRTLSYAQLPQGAITSSAASPELRFQRFSAQDGLSEQMPFNPNILQDQKGFLWIPSYHGLNRFDGRSFKVYRNQEKKAEGPSNNTIYNLCQDSEGKIWMGLWVGLLNIFDPETETFQEIGHDFSPLEKSCVSTVQAINRDEDGNMWLSVEEGICRCERGTWNFKKYDLNGKRGASFLQQKNGTIWAGTQLGLFRYLPERDTFVFYEPNPKLSGSIPHNKAQQMIEVGGEIWITSKRKGQFIFNPETEVFRNFPTSVEYGESAATAMMQGRDGQLWFGHQGTISRFDPKNQATSRWKHNPLDPTTCQEGYIVNVFQDRTGSVWFSAYPSSGLSVIHTLNNPFQVLPPGDYKAVAPWNEEQVLLSTERSFQVYNTQKGMIVPDALPSALASAVGDCIRLTEDHTLWWRDPVQRKVLSYNLITHQQKEVNLNGHFEVDSQGNLWFMGRAVHFYDNKNDRLESKRQHFIDLEGSGLLEQEMFNSVTLDAQDRVWIGTTTNGLLMYDPAADSLSIIKHRPGDPNSLPNAYISLVLAGRNGWIYIRNEFGLSIYKPEIDSVINIPMSDGLPRHLVFPMIEDTNGQLWLGSLKGLARLNTQDNSLHYFDEQDGLPHGKFDHGIYGTDSRGFLYFSKKGRLFRFHPDSVHLKLFIEDIAFTDFYLKRKRLAVGQYDSLLRKQIAYQEKVVLDHTQSNFGFQFVSPTFYKAEQLEYFYRLKNYDQDWIALGNKNEAHFTNIPAGAYQFQVKAQSAAGSWTRAPTSVSIVVLPPWWQTGWAYALYSVMAIATIWSLRQYDLRRLEAKNEAKRLLELDQLKTRLYTNITHEFRTPLTVIQGMADQIEKHPLQAKQLIGRNSKNLLKLVNQLLDMSKLEAGKMELKLIRNNIISYLKYLKESFQSYAESRDIQLTFQTEIHERVMDYDPEKMQHVMVNLLSNAIKFTQKGGEVRVAVSESAELMKPSEPPLLKIQVIDSGIGIQETNLPHIFDRFYQVDDTHTRQGEGSGIGLALAKELVELMGGSISVKSEWARGTMFTILLPTLVDHTQDAKPTFLEKTFPKDFPIPVKTDPETTAGKVLEADLLPAHSANTDLPLLLIIEDNIDVVAYIRTCLEGKYQIRAAYDGQQGIEQALEIIPDIIISDVMMPEKDGFEVTQFLKHDERTSHIPIILLTAKADAGSKLEGLKRGADAYLAKPFDQQELLIRLAKLRELRQKLQARYSNLAPPKQSADPGLQLEDAFLRKVQQAVETYLDEAEFGVAELCRTLGSSQPQLYRKIKALTGRSIAVHMRSIRLQHGYELLKTTNMNVSEVAYKVGFTDPNYFSKTFSSEFGLSPSEVVK